MRCHHNSQSKNQLTMKTTVRILALTIAACAGSSAAEPNPAIKANTNFACDLYQQLAGENEGKNIFFSPYSVSSALAMTAEGARGETALQMGKVLRYPESAATKDASTPWKMAPIHSGMAALNERFNSKKDPVVVAETKAKIADLEKQLEELKANHDPRKLGYRVDPKQVELAKEINAARAQLDQYELNLANALWVEKSYPFKDDYLKKIGKFYNTGGAFPVDFKGEFEEVRLEINSWVEGKTERRIKDLIPQGAVDDLTRLVLVNAIYFKGDWAKPFKVENTKDRDFTRADGTTVAKPTMSANALKEASYATFNGDGSSFKTPLNINSSGPRPELYSGKDGFAMLELPYMGNELSMLIIAPNDPGQLAAVEGKLTPENLAAWIAKLNQRKVHVLLPKFKVETDYSFGNTLKKMGMTQAFADPRKPNGAVFDGMSHATDPNNKLYISKVIHKAFVEVSEKGTEAAAATAVIMAVPTSAPISYPFTPTFKADRPFLYLIRDRVTGSILFMGRMMEPTT